MANLPGWPHQDVNAILDRQFAIESNSYVILRSTGAGRLLGCFAQSPEHEEDQR
jgi:hypothetical protein